MAGAAKSLAALRQQLDLDRKEAARIASLKQAGVMSQSAQDAADAAVAEHERQLADSEAVLKRSSERRNAAKNGVFLLEDGTDGNSTLQNLSDARVRLVQAQQSLIQLRAERQAAQMVVDAAKLAYEKARSIDILAPPGSMVWSLISSPGGSVQPGTPVASWVDCTVMLVDAPVSDVEAALLHVGSRADVAIEGERHVRVGTAILTRGSAGVLADNDLAAVAKGRHPGVGQVLVKLVPTPDDVKTCDIGRAAYVDFPEVGVFDLIRARLRL
jgi:multidrug resistance efflux pump